VPERAAVAQRTPAQGRVQAPVPVWGLAWVRRAPRPAGQPTEPAGAARQQEEEPPEAVRQAAAQRAVVLRAAVLQVAVLQVAVLQVAVLQVAVRAAGQQAVAPQAFLPPPASSRTSSKARTPSAWARAPGQVPGRQARPTTGAPACRGSRQAVFS
jgi:hypothetical protein